MNTEAVGDLLAYLNQREFTDGGGDRGDRPLYADGERIHARYAGWRLDTLFQPIVDLNEGDAIGHEALLRVHTPNGTLAPEVLFQQRADVAGITYLDRLARTLHALNFLVRELRGALHLNVHPHHLLAVSTDHGRVFEGILRQCGLAPEQIVLEVAEHAIREKQRLRHAIAAWQGKGYRIAIDNFGCGHTQLARVLNLAPDIIKLDRRLLSAAELQPRSRQTLAELSIRAGVRDIRVIATGIETAAQLALVKELRFGLGQGFLLGMPAADGTAAVAPAPRFTAFAS